MMSVEMCFGSYIGVLISVSELSNSLVISGRMTHSQSKNFREAESRLRGDYRNLIERGYCIGIISALSHGQR